MPASSGLPLGRSELGESELGESELGESELGGPESGDSVLGVSGEDWGPSEMTGGGISSSSAASAAVHSGPSAPMRISRHAS